MNERPMLSEDSVNTRHCDGGGMETRRAVRWVDQQYSPWTDVRVTPWQEMERQGNVRDSRTRT